MEIAYILGKKLNGSLSVEEQKYFDNWIKESDENRNLFLRLQSLHNTGERIPEVDDIDIDAVWTNVLKVAKLKNNKKLVPLLSLITKYAAIFIGIFTISYLYWQTNNSATTLPINEDAITLQLENGEIQQISPEKMQTIT